MNIRGIAEIIDGKVKCCGEKLFANIEYAFSSDLKSDILKQKNILELKTSTAVNCPGI